MVLSEVFRLVARINEVSISTNVTGDVAVRKGTQASLAATVLIFIAVSNFLAIIAIPFKLEEAKPALQVVASGGRRRRRSWGRCVGCHERGKGESYETK